MSKARTLADFISDGSEFADGTISVAEVSGAAPLASPTFTGTASGTFSGPLTGNVTGNVTGDLTGDVTGNVTGNLTGNVTGDVAGDIDLSAIAATIADTAVDIFVYDTRKDSDGGAWRKRTQHTSWYNEAASSTRGSRKEFPAVAVIVVDNSDKITIYDGDDPDLPMWMIANTSNQMFFETNPFCVSALNAKIAIGNNPYDLAVVDFLKDESVEYATSRITVWSGGIAKRNQPNSALSGQNIETYGIISRNVNDVAMTVLPNAPIDAATGLPVPTIAVATDGGVSVIKDDGTVVDITHTASTNNGATDISFDGNQISYATQQSGSSTNYWRKAFIDIPSADVTGSYTHNISGMTVYDARGTSSNSGVALNTNSNLGDATNDIKAAVHDAVGFTNKLTLLDVDYYSDAGTPSESGSMVAYASSDYNTGWMNGDIKLATLSDTDATNVTGSELVTNGDFSSALGAEWDLSTGSGTIAIVSGQLEITQGSYSSIMYAAQDFATVSGKTYTVSFKVVATTEANYFRVKVGTSANATDLGVTSTLTAAGEYSITFTATGSTSWVTLHSDQNANKKTTWDNVSVRLAEEDRSVNGNGLQVFGTVTKSAVATGADLVAYSGFTYSDSNRLEQPYNSDLDFGTGDFSIHIWMNTTGGSTRYLYSLYDSATTTGFAAYMLANGTLDTWVADSTQGYALYSTRTVNDGAWHLVSFVRKGATTSQYIDGTFENSRTIASGANLSASNNKPLVIANYSNLGYRWQGSLALLRISATAPSPEQIKKIYEDEKVLFQEGAQATLYGSSDAVTALAYDDSTDLLHVGTSSGRSVFQGLRRVDNTTTAVGAAISASNGLVADE